ncbi:MAG: class I tRNA ligase family protein, partial [bacterium]|nr:class I tRNA ligase family protein [bacterium]
AFYNTTCPKCDGPAKRETDTMDTFFDSSWYFFRYAGPSDTEPFDRDEAKLWMTPDIYIGGIEHAILHLIYARFFTKVFRDFGWTDVSEPFPYLLTQGMVSLDGSVMSKSKGNIVDPDDMVAKFGADTTRLFILFAAPPEKGVDWNEKGVEGCHRFLMRIWNFFEACREIITDHKDIDAAGLSLQDDGSKKIYIKLNQTIKKVTDDIDQRFHHNTAIAALMEFFNDFSVARETLAANNPGLLAYGFNALLKLLTPFTPHFTNELWHVGGRPVTDLLEEETWPQYDPDFLSAQSVNIMIQVNGKIRDKIVVNLDETEEAVKEAAFQSEKIKGYTDGKQIIKTIHIKNKMFSIVVK